MATTTDVSRRSFLSAAPAALAGATAALPLAALADVNPDAELLRLDREHDIAYAATFGGGPDGLDDDELTELCDALRDVEYAIHGIPAQALAGLAVKARLASVYLEPDSPDPLMMGIFTSLVEDILRIAHVTAKPSIALPPLTPEA